jgi:hypothetical protein
MARKLQEQVEDSRDEEIETQKKLLLKPDELIHFINRDLPTDLLSPQSLKIFSRFNIPSDFLEVDPLEWNNNNEYLKARSVLASLKVVNDTAERNVKLMEEYNQKMTKNEEQKQFLLKVCIFLILL